MWIALRCVTAKQCIYSVYVKGCELQKTWRLEAHLWKYVQVAQCNKNHTLLVLLTLMNPYIVI